MPKVRVCLEIDWGLFYNLGPLQLETWELREGRPPCRADLTGVGGGAVV